MQGLDQASVRLALIHRLAADPQVQARLKRLAWHTRLQANDGPAAAAIGPRIALDIVSQLATRPEAVNLDEHLVLEAIIRVVGRPLYDVAHHSLKWSDIAPEWRAQLEELGDRGRLGRVIAGSGRVQISFGGATDLIGTAFVVSPEVLLTNRHVAEFFARRKEGGGAEFLSAGEVPFEALVDFEVEMTPAPSKFSGFSVTRVLHMSEANEPDLALLQIKWTNGASRQPLVLATAMNASRELAVVGHPLRDARVQLHEVMQRIFRNVFGIKRVAPGRVLNVPSLPDPFFAHDCTTLGGNSGSAVIELAAGAVVGIHFWGQESLANLAISGDHIVTYLRTQGVQPTLKWSAGEIGR